MSKYEFDAQKKTEGCIDWIKNYLRDSGASRVILGISGGKDSYVAAALCCKAIGAENVIGVLMPNGEQKDISDSIEVCKNLGIQMLSVNIYDAYNDILESIYDNNIEVSEEAKINIAPRLRMTTLYTIGQTLHARVCGTGNLSEATVGYCTKWGDTACDFNPLAGFTSIEVVKIGEYLGLDSKIIYKEPSDGLCGKTDEERLGISYIDIHNYLRNPDEVYPCVKIKIESKFNSSRHKFSEISHF